MDWTNSLSGKRAVFFILVSIGVVFLPNIVHADSLRCSSKLVSTGDLMREVEDICGLPSFIYTFQEENTITTYKKIPERSEDGGKNSENKEHSDIEDGYEFVNERSSISNIEKWTYNFGSHRFIQVFTFKNGRLVSIKSGDYGFDPTDTNLEVNLGDSRAVVFMKYGSTSDIKKRLSYDVDVSRRAEGMYLYVKKHSVPIDQEEWIYDLGPDRYLQQLIFRNNSLIQINSLKVKGKSKETK